MPLPARRATPDGHPLATRPWFQAQAPAVTRADQRVAALGLRGMIAAVHTDVDGRSEALFLQELRPLQASRHEPSCANLTGMAPKSFAPRFHISRSLRNLRK